MAAARFPARSEPVNSQFFLPSAMGRIVFSTGLLSIGRCPLSAQRNVTMHEEFGGFNVELFGDVFADFYQIAAALFALTGFRLMAVFDARQVIR